MEVNGFYDAKKRNTHENAYFDEIYASTKLFLCFPSYVYPLLYISLKLKDNMEIEIHRGLMVYLSPERTIESKEADLDIHRGLVLAVRS